MLERVYTYCQDHDIGLADLDGDIFERFLDTQNWTANTKYLAYCAVKSYSRFTFGQSGRMSDYRMKRVKPALQRTLSVKDAQKLFESIDTSTEIGRRNLAIVTLMVNCGLRSFEVSGALTRSLDLKAMRIQVLCKGENLRTAKFTRYTATCIASWLGVREAWARRVPCQQTLFISKKGKKLSTSGMRKLFDRLAARAGLEALSPHDLRRTFATISTQAGAPTRVVMAAGGWSDVTSFIRYTQAINPDDLEPFNPVDYIMGN